MSSLFDFSSSLKLTKEFYENGSPDFRFGEKKETSVGCSSQGRLLQQGHKNKDNCSLAGSITYFIRPEIESSIPQGQSWMAVDGKKKIGYSRKKNMSGRTIT